MDLACMHSMTYAEIMALTVLFEETMLLLLDPLLHRSSSPPTKPS